MKSAKRDVEAVLARNGAVRVLLFQGVRACSTCTARRRVRGGVGRCGGWSGLGVPGRGTRRVEARERPARRVRAEASGALVNAVIVGAAAQAMMEGWVLQTGAFAGGGAQASTTP
ncbi:hypothetical protein HU200_047450 [Digitaria exilis]|uniref:Uncharacterized protein n=1 Tax=Digitaria exilis TaxID=1010633 RepID=A0A835AXD8_9POAL|nr:hypothetical protein HU200_047450 [Digitaria exilis]